MPHPPEIKNLEALKILSGIRLQEKKKRKYAQK